MHTEIEAQIIALEKEIAKATTEDRLRYHPIVQKMIDGISARGQRVPKSLLRINSDLADDAYEDMFNNMPI